MTTYTIPDIYTRVIDQAVSFTRSRLTVFGMVGTASKGPFDSPQLITTESQWYDTFGPPKSGVETSFLSARGFLRKGQLMWFVRVGDGSQEYANYNFPDSGGLSGLTVEAVSKGTWGNDIKAAVVESTYGFGVDVYYLGNLVESFSNLSNTGAASTTGTTVAINGKSNYIQVVAGTVDPVVASYSLTGGADGVAGITDGVYIGSTVGQTSTGLQTFANPNSIDVDIIACPERPTRPVQDALVNIAEAREDCVAILTPPDNLSASGVVDYVKGQGDYSAYSGIDTSRAATYYPYVKTYNDFLGSYAWVPPVGVMAGNYAYVDSVEYPWFAPAGEVRGDMSGYAADLRQDFTSAELSDLISVKINPIIKTPTSVHANGQFTLYQHDSALNRINVRRLLLYIREGALSVGERLVHAPNDEGTWGEFVGRMDPLMRYIANRRGVREYNIICDSTLNTPAVRANYEMHANLYIKPTKSAEFIVLNFVLKEQGATLTESA